VNTPTDHGIDTAAAALAKASLFDPTIRHNDPAVIAAWAQLLDDIDPDEAVYAVDKHYATTSGKRVMPADIINLVRARRQDQHLRSVVRRREIEAPRDRAASHAGYLAARNTAAAALAGAGLVTDTADLSQPCPWCHSRVGEACTTNGAPRTSSHPSRPVSVTA
jgi:hypothetical protein